MKNGSPLAIISYAEPYAILNHFHARQTLFTLESTATVINANALSKKEAYLHIIRCVKEGTAAVIEAEATAVTVGLTAAVAGKGDQCIDAHAVNTPASGCRAGTDSAVSGSAASGIWTDFDTLA